MYKKLQQFNQYESNEQFYNKDEMMLKLNDFINPQRKGQGVALMRCLKNSIKRNIMLPSLELSKSQASFEYETKLTRHNFREKDLILLFEHLYAKQEMSVPDRNLIRRILLTMFDQNLIAAGGKQLIMQTKLLKYGKGEKIVGNNMFYFVIKGVVRIQSPFYQKIISNGQCFGHFQILTNMPFDSFIAKFQQNTHILAVQAVSFRSGLSQYFNKKYNPMNQFLPKIFTSKLEPVELLLICQEMQQKVFSIGTKICKKGQPITQIQFIKQGQINQNYQLESQTKHKKIKVENCIGLQQIFSGSKYYFEDIFTLQQTRVYSIPLKNILKYLVKNQQYLSNSQAKQIRQSQLLSSVQNYSKLSNSKSNSNDKAHSKTEMSQIQNIKTQQQIQSIKKFLRIRKVNLPYNSTRNKSPIAAIQQQSSQKSTSITKLSSFKHKYQTSFVFIRDNTSNLTTATSKNKNSRIIRSLSLMKQQPCASDVKRYLDYVDVPSLEQFKITKSQLF